MKTRTKKMLSLLLAAAMVLSMNTMAYAGEAGEDENSVISEMPAGVYDACIDEDQGSTEPDKDTVSNITVTPNFAPDAIKEISENFASLSENLNAKAYTIVSGNTNTYLIVHERATGYQGYKFVADDKNGNATEVAVEVYSAPKDSVSGTDVAVILARDRKTTPSIDTCFDPEYETKVKIKSSKGATVRLNGEGIVPVKKATYISSITLKDKAKNAELKALLKPMVDKIKKADKSVMVSANGFRNGSDKEEDRYDLVIAVYPAFIGNCVKSIAGTPTCTGDSIWSDIVKYITGVSPYDVRHFGPRKGLLKIDSVNIETKKLTGVYRQNFKVKNGDVRSIKTGFYVGPARDKFKAYTMKPTKDPSKKRMGIANAKGEPYDYYNPADNATYRVNKIEADGNCFGTIYYPDSIPKG